MAVGLPHRPQPIDLTVMQKEDGIVGRRVATRHVAGSEWSAHPAVRVVVHARCALERRSERAVAQLAERAQDIGLRGESRADLGNGPVG